MGNTRGYRAAGPAFFFYYSAERVKRIGGNAGLAVIVERAFQEILIHDNVDSLYNFVHSEATTTYKNAATSHWAGKNSFSNWRPYALVFLQPLLVETESANLKAETAEEKIAYALIGHAIVRAYEFFAKPD